MVDGGRAVSSKVLVIGVLGWSVDRLCGVFWTVFVFIFAFDWACLVF
jgi:hypothetical protein